MRRRGAPSRGARGRQAYGDKATLVGIGYYQTVSTRNAGIQLIDLRKCNQARAAPTPTPRPPAPARAHTRGRARAEGAGCA